MTVDVIFLELVEESWDRLLAGGRRPPLVIAVSVSPTETTDNERVFEAIMESGRAVIDVVEVVDVSNDVDVSCVVKEVDVYPDAGVVDWTADTEGVIIIVVIGVVRLPPAAVV